MKTKLTRDLLLRSYKLMTTAKAMTDLYEAHFKFVSKYVHATSRGHEAVQIAMGLQLKATDFLSAYYRDDALLLSIGMQPYELMLQLMAKRDDPFSGGRSYYSHPSLRRDDRVKIPHQSSATGMQAIPTTGIAMGLQYRKAMGLDPADSDKVVVCSLGDASITEGEVAEAFHMASLKKMPILYLIQDNEWDISAHSTEIRRGNAVDYAKGFPGMKAITIDGTNFSTCYQEIQAALEYLRSGKGPYLVHAKVPLLNHHTSGVRKEWYRDDLDKALAADPLPKLKDYMLRNEFSDEELEAIERESVQAVSSDFERARAAEDPRPEDLYLHDYAPTPVLHESGTRCPDQAEEKVMVDCALFAIEELMSAYPECLLYGQDVGKRLGGVFREAATLAQKFGDHRVFNTPIQEAFIVGSTVGMSAAGLKPIVEVQFADYIWPGLNQLFTEVARSCYLSNGKWPVSMILRVPIGAYGSGGPYHSSSVETIVANIKGVKIAYPSNGADLKGLIKAAYHDPNPVVIFEHKGLYWSKVPGTEAARCKMPDESYILPFGQARVVLEAETSPAQSTLTIVSYGMGVHWALNAATAFDQRIEIIDLRTIAPLDLDTVYVSVRKHGRCLVVTEETIDNCFAQSLAARIQEDCFSSLDAPVVTVGSRNLPAIPLNSTLEAEMLLNAEKLQVKIAELLRY